jgi:hypothetical protein
MFQHLTNFQGFLDHELVHNLLLGDVRSQHKFIHDVSTLLAQDSLKMINLNKIDSIATQLQETFSIKKDKKRVIKAILCAAKLREILLSSPKYHGPPHKLTSLEYFQEAIECAKEHMELHPSKSKNLVLMIGSLLEGSGKQYATGGSEAQATKDRVQLFHKLYEYAPKERPSNNKRKAKSLDCEGEGGDESSCSSQSTLSHSMITAASERIRQEIQQEEEQQQQPPPQMKKAKICDIPLVSEAAIPIEDDNNPIVTKEMIHKLQEGGDAGMEGRLEDCDDFDWSYDPSIAELVVLLPTPRT